MIYSQWDQGRRQYDYFEVPLNQPTANTPAPTHLRQRKLGTTVAQAGWPIPKNARRIGCGDYPRGRIGTRNPQGASEVNWWVVGIIGVGILYLWKNQKGKR